MIRILQSHWGRVRQSDIRCRGTFHNAGKRTGLFGTYFSVRQTALSCGHGQPGNCWRSGIFKLHQTQAFTWSGDKRICKKALWGNQIGTRFMEQLIEFAQKTAKTEILSLKVRSDNERAIALYKRFGFEKVGTFNGYMKINGIDVNCDIMRLCLSHKETNEGYETS